MEILTVENLTFTYPLCGAAAVNGVSFGIRPGEFAVLCGGTGSGKSTLLRLLKRELSPLGEKSGRILCRGVPMEDLPAAESACSVGFVMQKPEQQLVNGQGLARAGLRAGKYESPPGGHRPAGRGNGELFRD